MDDKQKPSGSQGPSEKVVKKKTDDDNETDDDDETDDESEWSDSEDDCAVEIQEVSIDPELFGCMRGIEDFEDHSHINVVLLSLVHAPVFRDYFLSIKHKCFKVRCITPDPEEVEESHGCPNLETVTCFACEMSIIVQEFFCGKQEPLDLLRFTHLLYLHEDDFEYPEINYDAYVFFVVFLSFLHFHHQGPREKKPYSIDLSCNCIIDTIFTFSLHQEYTFQDCKHKLMHVDGSRGLCLKLQLTNKEGASSVMDGNSELKLLDLLKEYQSEVARKTCDSCKEIKEYHKNTTLNRLPIVLAINLQEHSELYLSFPEFLDMTLFMTKSTKEQDKPENDLSNVSNNMYYLLAVVDYTGDLQEDGHHTAYVRRHKEEWFFVDGEDVTKVKLQDALAAKACILFYHKEKYETMMTGKELV